MNLTQELMKYLATGLTILSILAFAVSIVTQVIKNIGKLKEVATNIVVMALSLVITLVSMIAYLQYIKTPILWYYVFAAILASFIVSIVSTSGWKMVFDIWNKVRTNISEEEWNKRAEEIQKELENKEVE